MAFQEKRAKITPKSDRTGNYVTSTTGSDNVNFSNLFWGKTNQSGYYCAFCYVKNLHATKALELTYSIQGHITSGGGGKTWATVSNNGSSNRSARTISIPKNSTGILEFNVRDYGNKTAQIYNGAQMVNITFDRLFWRINVTNLDNDTIFEILDEKTNDGKHLADKFGSVNFNSVPYSVTVN